MGNKSTSYAWTCLFNCAVHANNVLHNDLCHCEVVGPLSSILRIIF